MRAELAIKNKTSMKFEEKVKSMTSSEIIMAMVNGLRAKYYTLDMNTFGETMGETCYGCAATHCIAEISGVVFGSKEVANDSTVRGDVIGSSAAFLIDFEAGIDGLRRGNTFFFNGVAEEIGISKIIFRILSFSLLL